MIATQQQHIVTLQCRWILATALATAFADPRTPAADPGQAINGELLSGAWLELTEPSTDVKLAPLGLGERRCTEASAESLSDWLNRDLERRARVYQEVFGLVVNKQCPQYETEYCEWKDTTYRSQKMADIAGFYHAFGVEPSRTNPDRHDHVAHELTFVALLLEKQCHAISGQGAQAAEHAELCRSALAAFVTDHIRWWVPAFAHALQRRIQQLTDSVEAELADDLQCLAGVAQFLSAWAAVERQSCNVEPYLRIVQPSVQVVDAEDKDCGMCSQCTPT